LQKAGERFGDEIDITRSDGKMFRYRADASSVVRLDSSDIDPLSHGHERVLLAIRRPGGRARTLSSACHHDRARHLIARVRLFKLRQSREMFWGKQGRD
jgi:hypothetical protein